MKDDYISRQAAIDAIMGEPTDAHYPSWYAERLEQLPSAQQERIIYGNMSDEEFEKWLYEHGICSPNIHESIPCYAVPLLIDDAISELPSAQPEPLSDAYTKAVWTWLLEYQIKAAELKGRYTPYEVLSWVANDWRKEHERSD